MEIAHLQLLSLLDYPGKVSAVIWTVGCTLRCPFCYNAELVLPEIGESLPRLPVEEVLAKLRERAGFLDGVVVTGGEPTLHSALPALLREVKRLSLLVKLDTNGTRPEVLRSLVEEGLVDYVAFDVKAPFGRYGEFTGTERSLAGWPVRDPGVAHEAQRYRSGSVASGLAPDVVAAVRETVGIVQERAPAYEFRTTVAPGLTPRDLLEIAGEIRGARSYVLQPFFVPEGKRLVDETWRGRPALSVEAMRRFLPEIQKLVPTELRG